MMEKIRLLPIAFTVIYRSWVVVMLSLILDWVSEGAIPLGLMTTLGLISAALSSYPRSR